jgi:26 proteasome complex subunit DSS1
MSNSTQNKETTEQPQQQKPQVLEEDDEFEDFPVEGRQSGSANWISELTKYPDWPQEEAEQTAGSTANGGSEHLWEKSWDDDDAAEDFSKQLQCVHSSHRSINQYP